MSNSIIVKSFILALDPHLNKICRKLAGNCLMGEAEMILIMAPLQVTTG